MPTVQHVNGPVDLNWPKYFYLKFKKIKSNFEKNDGELNLPTDISKKTNGMPTRSKKIK